MKDTHLSLVSENKLAIPGRTEDRPSFKLVKTKAKRGEQLDSLIHRSVYKKFAVEVWQERATVGTVKPKYYTLRFNTDVTCRYPRASREDGFSTVARALARTEHLIDERRYVIDKGPPPSVIRKRNRARHRKYKPPSRRDPDRLSEALDAAADTYAPGLDVPCPVCTQAVSRSFFALHSHLGKHVRAKEITADEKRMIQGRLVPKRGKKHA